MGQIDIRAGDTYPGEGISRGLARGLQVTYQDCNLTGEGMGIGSIALRDHAFTYFSRSFTDSVEHGRVTRTFSIDTRMMWGIHGKPSSLLTRLIEYATRFYMRIPRAQVLLMLPVFPLRTLFGIHPTFEPVSPRGKVTFSYLVKGNTIEVQVSKGEPLEKQEKLFLLNELSARWFVAGWRHGRRTAPPPGWERISQDDLPVSFHDPVHGIRFFLDGVSVPPAIPFAIFQGREYGKDLAWAGFCIQIGPADTIQNLSPITYRIGLSKGWSS